MKPALLVALGASMLSGCSVLSVNPTLELVKAGGAVALSAISTGPSSARNSVQHAHPAIETVCVEYNPVTPDPDIVPALQQELRALAVDSRVYEDDALPPSCQFRLGYTADIDWDTPPMGSGLKAYLRDATLTLRGQDGAVIASSSYQLDDAFKMGKWADDRRKLAPLVTQIITGFDR